MITSWRDGASWGRIALAALGFELAAVLLMAVVGAASRREVRGDPAVRTTLAASLQLTDLALWSAASYCRHLSRADLFAAHGLHPAAPDLFPAGSIVAPPQAIRENGGWTVGSVVP